MRTSRGLMLDPVTAVGAVVGIVALAWLAPLMTDQLVFFGDHEQWRQAAASRQAMLPAGVLLLVAAVGAPARHRPWHALLVALPVLVAVPLAWLAPGGAYQLLAYGITAPISLGALLAAVAPLPRTPAMPAALVGMAVLAALTVVASTFIALMALLAGVVWWRLPTGEAESLQAAHRG